jgi:hypothetical protein
VLADAVLADAVLANGIALSAVVASSTRRNLVMAISVPGITFVTRRRGSTNKR